MNISIKRGFVVLAATTFAMLSGVGAMTASASVNDPAVNCPANWGGGMWEITWGMQNTDTNGVPTFDMNSYGGMTSLNGAAIPAYMTSYGNGTAWKWLYVTPANVQSGRVINYGFSDGTKIKATVSGTELGCPTVQWITTPPPPPEPILHETYSWLTTLKPGVTTGPESWTATDVTWNQILRGIGVHVPKCEEILQIDDYVGTRSEIDAVVGDGILTGLPPEDSGIIVAWHFAVGGPCPVIVPPTGEPVPPVVTETPDVPVIPVTVQSDGGQLNSGNTSSLLILGGIAGLMAIAGSAFAVRKNREN